MANWYIFQNGIQKGPLTIEQLSAEHIMPDTMVWREGMAQWTEAGRMAELSFLFAGTTPPPHYQARPSGIYSDPMNSTYQNTPLYTSGKDKTVAGILAILFGWLGLQYFYLGKVAGGFITILLSLVTCGIWSTLMFAQGIVMLVMNQEEFDRKYVYTDKTLPLF